MTASIDTIRNEIKEIIRSEDKQHPYSDEKIHQLLEEDGFVISRKKCNLIPKGMRHTVLTESKDYPYIERIVIMNILDVAFVEELVDACQYFWEAGWGEYHAGNISYLLSDDEFDQLKEYMQVSASVDVAFDTAGLKGKAFIVTKSGACFRTMKKK